MLQIARAAGLVLAAAASPALAASVTYESDLVYSSESFLGATVLDGDGTPVVLDGTVGGADNAFGFTGRFSDLAVGDRVSFTLVYDTDDMQGGLTRLVSCQIGGLSCLDDTSPFTALPDAAGAVAVGKGSGPDLYIAGRLVPGATVEFAELYANGPAASPFDGFYTDYLAEFTVAMPAVPLPATAPLLLTPLVLGWAVLRRRARNSGARA